MEDASDELFVVIELWRPFILVAADELFVVTVLLRLVTEELRVFREPEVATYDEFNAV